MPNKIATANINWIDLILNEYTIITIVATVIIFVYQHFKHKRSRYNQCARDLYREDNHTAQLTSAILLRSYLKPRRFGRIYVKDTLNLIVAILRSIPNGNFQKTLADSISFVSKADGQDFQYANMHKCSIKPQSRIRYEITKNKNLLQKRISMRCADFFKADISLSGIYSINAENGIFYDCLLYDTTFHNCILREADFRDSDVHNLKFKECDLMGANFAGARQIETVKVYDEDNTCRPLLDFLDKSGRFVGPQKQQQYLTNTSPIKIFVSKLGSMNTQQRSYHTHLINYLTETYNYQFEHIDPKDYRNSGQIESIVGMMSQCSGILILAFSYMRVTNGNMVGYSNDICNENHISPWIQIEAALANALYKLPCLVVTEESVCHNGFFDDNVMKNAEQVHQINYYNGVFSSNDEKILAAWSRMVEQHHSKTHQI